MMRMLKLVLIRHGFSKGNEERRLAGWTDVALSDVGIDELYQLKKEYEYPETEKYYSSDLLRCVQTFQILFGDKRRLDDLLPEFREINFGTLENISQEETIQRRFFHNWIVGNAIEDEEKYEDFYSRIKAALYGLAARCVDNCVHSATLVCHEGVIRIIILIMKNMGAESFFSIKVPNGLGYELDIMWKEGQMQMVGCQPIQSKISGDAAKADR